ncbi:LysR family transcriptional regulator [Dyella jiangningensis]|uniref:LysR family transcriptional regulator n=1 Tax=Dyella jiangningensis TaxID=1379159 RepID=UPI0004564206|nr:LysR family transcriptional regulator [Dyella jiangningensis]AHX12171.1 LysR family transcriptional regulator [Dyella jiangningensis]MDG2537059.1 LysR family transcriptional regulator [Dyella jiangningensis]
MERIDLNLFRVLDAIYTQGGVSAAARTLHLTQPAVTHALGRLRDHLGDPLFVRQGNRLLPTEKVRAMMPSVQSHLKGLLASAHAQATFAPSRLQMEFAIGFRDILESIALPRLMAEIGPEAPGVRLVSRRVAADEMERELSAGTLDLVVDRPLRAGTRISRQHLLDETLVVAMRRGHPSARQLSRADYLAAPHVVVSPLGEANALDTLLGQKGVFREVRMVAQHYFAACQIVAASDLLLTVPKAYAEHVAPLLPMALQPLPIRIKAFPIFAYWHDSKDGDPAHAWFRERLVKSITGAMQSSPT